MEDPGATALGAQAVLAADRHGSRPCHVLAWLTSCWSAAAAMMLIAFVVRLVGLFGGYAAA